MNSITLIMPYYENPGQLKRQYALLRTMPETIRKHVSLIIVDDCSAKSPAFREKIGMGLEVFRILPPKVPWNQDAARNIGAHHATTEWLLLTDIDHEIPEATWRRVIEGELSPSTVYRFSRISAKPDGTTEPYKEHPNTWLLTRHHYENCGGYDERFAGYYGTDGDFRNRVIEGMNFVQLDEVIVRIGREIVPDASTTQFKRKTIWDEKEIRRIKSERGKMKDWRPARFRFPYERVV